MKSAFSDAKNHERDSRAYARLNETTAPPYMGSSYHWDAGFASISDTVRAVLTRFIYVIGHEISIFD